MRLFTAPSSLNLQTKYYYWSKRQLTFNQPSVPTGMKVVSECKFVQNSKIHVLVAGLGALRRHIGVINSKTITKI